MPYIKYKEKRFHVPARKLIAQSDAIITEFMGKGLLLTLRGLYYQFIARDLFPDDRRWTQVGGSKWVRDPNGTKNATPNYKWLGDVMTDGRMAGLIDWDAIEDKTRRLTTWTAWDSPEELVESAAEEFDMDPWADQDHHVQVWVEKEALISYFDQSCAEYHLPYIACRGYGSQSMMWKAAQKMIRQFNDGKQPVILHFGDHDPSGIDMTRDIIDRLDTFTKRYGFSVDVRRMALNMDQIKEYNPPPNPAKVNDPRAETYIAEHGTVSWELDALSPEKISELVKNEAANFINWDRWDVTMKAIKDGRHNLQKISDNYDYIVSEFFGDDESEDDE